MASGSSNNITEYPFALEWEISQERLKGLKDSTKNEYLASNSFTAVHASNLQYFISIYPNGYGDQWRGKTTFYLHVNLGNEKKAEVECTFSIKSANWNYKMKCLFNQSTSSGYNFCTVNELFDSRKKFIVNEKFLLRVDGIFKIENVESKKENETAPNFRNLWKIGFEDFTIIADGKEIEVHKCIIASYSSVFCAMFSNPQFKEGIEDEVEIIDFPFEIVEKAIQICYRQRIASDFSIEENAMLLKFADKYDIVMIKENIEVYLSTQITVSNVCEMVNIAEEGNSSKLRNRCLDFFITCLMKKEFVPNLKLLDSEFCLTALKYSLCQKSQTV